MKKLLVLALFLYFSFSAQKSFASENFDISAEAIYEISETEPTRVTKNISILNKKEFIFSPTYSISFGFEDMKNIQVFNDAGSIPFDYETDEGIVRLDINFVNPPKGVNTRNNFTIRFETDEVVEKKGDIVEVDIPGISDPDSFLEYNTKIFAPSTLEAISIIKPAIKEAADRMEFSKEETKGAGIVMVFGDAQYYKFNLSYNISNPNLFPIETKIAFPPNTNYQTVYIEKLSEVPKNVEIDSDGNWIASYALALREKKTIHATVLVRVNAQPRKSKIEDWEIKTYTSPARYWEANAQEIRKIAENINSGEDVYKYVVDNLTYDYEKVSSESDRLGALGTLVNPTRAVCLEFSDLFVAIARSAGIPARTIEGYAYTRNSKLRPLSLGDDILHAWPEYYDFEKETWIMVDPTWGNTTNGIDYFNNFDLDHVAFAVKGTESTYPIPAGGYKFEEASQDIKVEFISEEQFKARNSFEIKDTFPKFSLAGIPISGFVTVKNTGSSYIENKTIYIANNNTGQVKEYTVKKLAPYGEESFSVTLDTSFLTNSSHEITMQVENFEKKKSVNVSFIPDLNLILIGGGIFVASALIAFTTVKTGRIYLQRRKK